MAYQVLARKYRPQRFSDVVGQDHVTRTLLNALSQNRIAHGYIFSGHRGIGKTTIARILAAALNCTSVVGSAERPTEEPCQICVNCREISSASRQESSIFEESHSFDVEEIDAATNRGIDDARLLTTKIQTRPTNKSKYKIIILDEAHQITDAAWNALLKTLEEPPEWAVFMFATTQPEDIPQTIRSRCQHFSFHAVKLDDIIAQLRMISVKENITIDDAALSVLAEAGDGSMRDALSIMDQAIASAPLVDGRPVLEATQVRELMGTVSNVIYEQILEAVHNNSSADVLAIVNRLLDAGNGAPQLARQFVRYLRNTIVAKITNLSPDTDATGIAADLLQISPEERRRAARSAALFTEEELSRFLSIMLRTFDDLGYRQEQRFHLELGLLKLVHMQRLIPVEDLLSQLGAPALKTANATSSLPAISAAVSKPAPPPAPAAARPAAAEADMWGGSAAAKPSPFDTDRSRKTPTASSSSAPMSVASTDGALALADSPKPEPVVAQNPRPHLVAPTPVAIQAEPFANPDVVVDAVSGIDPRALQQAFVEALASTKGQDTASHQIEESTFAMNGDTLEVQTTVSAKMIPIMINAEADRVMKTVLRTQNLGALKLKFLPGTAPVAPKERANRPAAAGSAEELASKHPIVQQARQLFSAEVIRVDDLRGKD